MKTICMLSVLYLSLVSGIANATSYKMVSAGYGHTCALDDSGVKCWGYNSDGQTTVPRLTNPKMVSAGWDNTCAIDDSGVKCWGNNSNGKSTVPSLTNPKMVSVGQRDTCALDDSGVKCWGFYGTVVPRLRNPKMVSVGLELICALDDSGVKCWGRNTYGQIIVPSLRNPKMVSAGYGHTCALDDSGVKCWGHNSDGQTTVRSLSNPKMISLGYGHTCALDDSVVKCWGDNSNDQSITPEEVRANADRKAEEARQADEAARKAAERKTEEVRQAAELAKIRSTLAQVIPAGSSFVFNKEILIEADKENVLIGANKGTINQCLFIVAEASPNQRKISVGKIYKINKVEVNADSVMTEALFSMEGSTSTISCLANYPSKILIGDVMDSVGSYGIELNVLKLPEPEDAP